MPRSSRSGPRRAPVAAPGVPNPATLRVGDLKSFLGLEHPIYKVWKRRWSQNEARMMGGDDVLHELRAFDWEVDTETLDPPAPYIQRQREAIYLNFPDIFMSAITGHLLRFSPQPGASLNMGQLGEVGAASGKPTQADQVFQHPDGPAQLGTDWDSWWANAMKLAGATGHRWIYVESPTDPPSSEQEELDGQRPYLTEYSPLEVPNWAFDGQGNLLFAVVRFWRYDPFRLLQLQTTSEVLPNPYYDYLLLVQQGYTGLGPDFETGGWWKFDPDKVQYDTGDFAETQGQIPMFPLFYERARGTTTRPAISRPGVTELGQAAIAAMNIMSAGNYNAWDNGQGLTFLAGVDEESQALALGQIKRGDRYIGLPPNQDTDATPTIHVKSSAEAGRLDPFQSREQAIWNAAVQLGVSEAVGTDASAGSGDGAGNTGSAQQARFSSGQAPRIVRVAQNLELAQNKALRFLELSYGYTTSTAKTQWPKKFDLVELTDRVKQFFEIQRLAGVSSPTLDSQAMVQVAEDKGLLTQPEAKQKVQQEFSRSANLKVQQQQQGAAANPGKMAPPQSQRTRDKQKARMAGAKADKAGPKKNPGGLR